MLCPIVCLVEFSWSPIEPKLFLAFSVSQPVEMHVHCLRLFGLDSLIDDTFRHGVIRLYWCGGLLVSHFFQNDSDVYCLACCNVKCCQFCFGGRRHDMLDYVRDVEDGSIVGRNFRVVGEKEMSTCLAPGLGLVEVACVAVYRECHVTR